MCRLSVLLIGAVLLRIKCTKKKYNNLHNFLNICMEIDTSLNPEELLDVCHDVENELNRVRTIRWGPRTIDVDILFFNDVVSDDKVLTLPHPRIKDRAFVLVPLMDLNENLVIDNKKGEAYENYYHFD